MAIQFELYKSPNPKDEEDKELYHARVVNFQHIDTDYLAKEIQQATSLTEGDVKAVLEIAEPLYGITPPGRGTCSPRRHRLLSSKAEQSGTDHLAQAESKPNETQSKHRLQGG